MLLLLLLFWLYSKDMLGEVWQEVYLNTGYLMIVIITDDNIWDEDF